jgi:hypothetical protein
MLANCYHGPSTIFSFERGFGFFIPDRTTGDDNRDANDFIYMIFVIFGGDGELVLFAGVRDYDWAQKAEVRYHVADKQMRERGTLRCSTIVRYLALGAFDACPFAKLSGRGPVEPYQEDLR